MRHTAGARKRMMGLLPLVPLLLAIESGCNHSPDASTPSLAYGTESGENAKARLFKVPADQMSHLQVLTVEASSLQRVLRLTGSVAYNNFETTPVITQVGGPISRIMVSPGDHVRAGQPLLEVASPDYAQDRTNYLKAQDAFALAQESYDRAKDLYAHHAIAEADLLQAVKAVASKKLFFSPTITQTLLEDYMRQMQNEGLEDSYDLLTVREKEVLQLLAEGKSNKEAASLLNVSLYTVETHRSRLMQKLNLHSTADIVLYAVRKRIIQ